MTSNFNLHKAIERSVVHLSQHPDTDIFPIPLDGLQFFKNQKNAIATILELHEKFGIISHRNPPELIRSLVPSGYAGYRMGTQIPPVWNAYYLSLVIACGKEIERIRLPKENVFSYRFQFEEANSILFDPTIGWHQFTDSTIQFCREKSYALVTDLSDFYHRIQLDVLVQALKLASVPAELIHRISELLQIFGIHHYGLPIGGPASRLLAELALTPLDLEISKLNITCLRFVDDLRIFANDEMQSQMQLQVISELAFKHGLTLQKSKTRILRTRDLIEEIDFSKTMLVTTEQSSTGLEIKSIPIPHDPYSELKAQMDQKLAEFAIQPEISSVIKNSFERPRIHLQSGRNLLSAMRFMPPQSLGALMIDLLENSNRSAMLPLMGKFLSTLRDSISKLAPQDVKKLRDLLFELFASAGPMVNIELHRALMLRVLCAIPTELASTFPQQFFDRLCKESSALVRREAIALCLLWQDQITLEKIASGNFLGPWEKPILSMKASEILSLSTIEQQTSLQHRISSDHASV